MSFDSTVMSATSANLTWSPPSYEVQNGVIIKYVVNVTVEEIGESFQLISNTTSLEVISLRPHRTYLCIIAAATSVGLGPFSRSITVKTPEDGKCFMFAGKKNSKDTLFSVYSSSS